MGKCAAGEATFGDLALQNLPGSLLTYQNPPRNLSPSSSANLPKVVNPTFLVYHTTFSPACLTIYSGRLAVPFPRGS